MKPRGRTARAVAAALLAGGVVAGGPLLVAAPAAAAGCSAPTGVYRQATPWPQRLLDPARVWPTTDGRGQTVAVIGTGIDAANAQFAPGQVRGGADVSADAGSASTGSATSDCDGRGTAAAGIVGAQTSTQTTFAGVAPGATLLPVRYTQTTGDTSSAGDPATLAVAIRAATAARAGVLLVVVPATTDSPALRGAVSAAVAAGEVVVSPASAGQAGSLTYPTAYAGSGGIAGVIGVGGVDENGAATQVEAGSDVLISGPGKDLVSTSAGAKGGVGNAYPLTDPGYAAAFVAGAVALLRSADPALTPVQVVNRLLLTADRPAGGGRDPRLGWGTVDPYAAVASVLPATAASPGAAAGPSVPRRIAPLAAPHRTGTPDRLPALIAVAGLALALAVALGAVALRRARARGWRPGRITV